MVPQDLVHRDTEKCIHQKQKLVHQYYTSGSGHAKPWYVQIRCE